MKYRILAILLIVAAALGYSYYQKQSLASQLVTDDKSEAAVLGKLPPSVFMTLEGEPFDVEALFVKERVDLLMVHYWGTWCAPCEAELPDLLALIKRFEGQPNIRFLLVAANDEVIKVKKHLKTLGMPKASIYWLIDNNNVHRDAYGTTRVPETFVFSSDKTTLRKFVGPQEWNKTMFFQTFDELIQISTHKL